MAEVTGNDILSYQGNAALGGGFTPNGVPFINTNPLGEFDQTIKKVQDENFQWNAKMYAQKVDDRDKLMQMMSQNTIDGDVLDDDRKVLQGHLDEIKNVMLKNPETALTDPTVYAQLNDLNQKFKTNAAAAKSRFLLIQGLKAQAASETNPTVREHMNKYIEDQQKGGINHIPNPYPKLYTYDLNKTWPNMPVPTKVIGYESKNGIGYENRETKPDAAWLQTIQGYYTTPNLQANNGDLLNQILTMYKSFQSPSFANQQNIAALNTQLDSINKTLGIQPGDPKYLEPVGQVGADGNVALNPDPVKFAYNMAVLKNYHAPKVESLPSEEAQKALRGKAENAASYASAASSYAAANNANANAENTRALTPYQIEEKKATIENLKVKYGADANAAKDASDNAFDMAKSLGSYMPFDKMLEKAGITTQSLGVPDGSEFAQIPKTNQNVIKMLSTPNINGKNGKYIGANTPFAMYSIKKPDGNISIIGIDKNGNILKSVDNPEDGANEIINYETNYNSKEKLKNQNLAALLYGRQPGSPQQQIQSQAQPQQAPQPQPAKSTGNLMLPMNDIKPEQVRETKEGVEVLHEGKWRKVISKNIANGTINLE